MNDLERWADALFPEEKPKEEAVQVRPRRAYSTTVTYKGKKEEILFLAHDDAHAIYLAEHLNGTDPRIIKFLNH